METRELARDELTAAELASLTRLANLVDPERLPGDPPMTEQFVYDMLSRGGHFYIRRAWAVFDAGEVVAYAEGDGAQNAENNELFEMTVAVHPNRRRAGLGTALFEHVQAVLRNDGRTRQWTWGPLDEATTAFWVGSLGLTLGYNERASRCVLADVDPTLMDAWTEAAGERASAYHLERWVGSCPDEFVEQFALAKQAMNDSPMDQLEFEDETYDVARMRDSEAVLEDLGFEHLVLMAVHTATCEAAGYTGVLIPRHRRPVSHQGDTVTLAAHRNQGIGRWMKAEMWKWVRSERPEVLSLDTGNAESNAAMLSINVAMGFRPVCNFGVWELR